MKLKINLEEFQYTHDLDIFEIDGLLRFLKDNGVRIMDEDGNDYTLSSYVYYDARNNCVDIVGDVAVD